MTHEKGTDERIPMFVESQRGDDRIGTDQGGNLISDHAASEIGASFKPGVPQSKIQEAVETQLKDEKWVVVEKKDGSSELLTKGDIPERSEEEREEDVPGGESGKEKMDDAEETDEAPEKADDDWKKVFGVVPVKPKPEEPAAKPACAAVPKKEKEEWKSKFENVKSATATHKGKGG